APALARRRLRLPGRAWPVPCPLRGHRPSVDHRRRRRLLRRWRSRTPVRHRFRRRPGLAAPVLHPVLLALPPRPSRLAPEAAHRQDRRRFPSSAVAGGNPTGAGGTPGRPEGAPPPPLPVLPPAGGGAGGGGASRPALRGAPVW